MDRISSFAISLPFSFSPQGKVIALTLAAVSAAALVVFLAIRAYTHQKSPPAPFNLSDAERKTFGRIFKKIDELPLYLHRKLHLKKVNRPLMRAVDRGQPVFLINVYTGGDPLSTLIENVITLRRNASGEWFQGALQDTLPRPVFFNASFTDKNGHLLADTPITQYYLRLHTLVTSRECEDLNKTTWRLKES